MTAEIGCAVFDALNLLEAADKILLIDAMKAGGPPGSVYLCDIVDIDENQEKRSLHHISVITALHSFVKKQASQIKLIGIEPGVIDYGLELTDVVQSSIPKVCQVAPLIAREWMMIIPT